MHHALDAIGFEDYEWVAVTKADVDKLSQVLHEETLFVDSDSDHALLLFREIMWTAAKDEEDYPIRASDPRA